MDITNLTTQRTRRVARLFALLPLAALIILTAVLYINALWWWYDEWTTEHSFYAHGIFIPFFVALMVWRDRERLRRLPIERAWWGLALVLLAIALVMFALRAEVSVTLSISFILFLIGATLVLAGKAITRALLFPMLFLFTMIPLVPDQLINPVAFPIQVTSAQMATGLFNLMGIHSVRTGTQIKMENYPLNVELPCSGFKTLIGLMAFAAAFAYLVQAAAWKRWLLFLVAAPLAIIINGIRITLIGLVGELFSANAAHTFHDYSGYIVLILGFMALFSLAKALKCEKFLNIPLLDEPEGAQSPKSPAPEHSNTKYQVPNAAPEEDYDAKYGPPRTDTLRRLSGGLYPLLGIVAIACVLKTQVKPPTSTIPPLTAAEIPSTLDGGVWAQIGEDRPITPSLQEYLKPKAWVDRDYIAAAPRTGFVNLLISAGDGRRVFHDPHTCLLGAGFFLHDVRKETIDTPAGPVTVQVAEAVNANDRTRSLLMFLYVVDGRQIQTTQGVNTAIMWQTLFGGTGRPSYFLRFRQLANGTGEERQEELRSFIRAVWASVAPKVVGTSARTRTVQRD